MKKSIYSLFIIAGALFVSCDDYLDENPDNRTTIDSADKVTKILVSAYSETLPILVLEQMSDNVTDRGSAYDWYNNNCADAYKFNEEFSSTSTDSPYEIWENTYAAIAAANTALEAIDELEAEGADDDMSAQKGEALLCRAYGHFTLCNVFCQAYNPQSSDTDLGIPYMKEVETSAINSYDRGTVAEVYENIAADLEEGLPLINDNLYTTPKYHFNKAAAYAFASQFYLYYGDYERAVECATTAIGKDPTSKLRDYSNWKSNTSSSEYTADWVDSDQTTNFLLHGCYSLAFRMLRSRAALTYALQYETMRSQGPWGSSSALVFGSTVYYYSTGATPAYFFPKQGEYFVYTNETAGIGYAHIVNVMFSTEKTLLNRAEAYTMLGEYDLAAADLSYFYVGSAYTSGTVSACSAEEIVSFYEDASDLYKKTISPRFTVEAGTQENMIHACLHARRVLTVHEGTRTLDLKRYGIAYTHELENDANIEITPFDPRLAVQIPSLVIEAGMEANPR